MAVDGILANGVAEILMKLSSFVTNGMILDWDFNDELKNLQHTLNMILALMEDTEKSENKQVSDGVVRLWMEELKSIAYDAEDILDNYSYEIIGMRMQTGKLRKPSLFFRWRMTHKIKKISEKFNKIAKHKNDLGLRTLDAQGSSSSSSHTMMMMNREAYSLVAANWKIVGRENDKSNIINKLLDKDSYFVLSTVGLGELGKTTMAQQVISDEAHRVEEDMAIDGIISNGVTEILKKLSFVVTNEITLVWDFNDELKNLQRTLNMILTVMEDAENKQVSFEVVRLWMEELKSIAYDAEDILDDYYYEIIGMHTQNGKVRKPSLFFRWRMAYKIKKINEKFNKIAKRKNDLGLRTLDVQGSSSSHTIIMINCETYSIYDVIWEIAGRENDKSKIVNKLLDKDPCFVHSIVGLGGLNKTTMAQLVYNDEAIKKDFQLKIWICVSDSFDVKKVLKNILNETGKNYNDAATMNDIVNGLQDALREKKFLLVLDDVWNQNSDDWYKLKTPLMVGAKGSKILVTTRSVVVASIMVDKFLPYPLGILNDTESWSLFKELAFGPAAAGAVETPKLVEIGKEMVKRCGGLSIAVIFLGNLMGSKKNEEEWENIRNSKIWHEFQAGKKTEHRILPSLRLSYAHLPSHLKQCFSYCCLFPKDYVIKKKTLIQLWMAEGFLIESRGDNAMSMEDIGNEYFHDLVSNFFFQDVERDYFDGDIVSCKMHDLVHDLARSVVRKNECLIIENADDIDCISEATIRLNLIHVDEGMFPKVFEALKNMKNLRTLFVDYGRTRFDIGEVLNKSKSLRVLDLGGSDIGESPACSIGELKHLRYLHLPEDFIIPEGIGRLRFLQTLNMFNLGGYTYGANPPEENACAIDELEGLNHLTEDLTIKHLESVTIWASGGRANLTKKKKLRRLNLTWYGNHPMTNHHFVLGDLQPHPNLRELCINGFVDSKLPFWMEDPSCLPNLVELTLCSCEIREQLAGFGVLPSLRSLDISYLKKLECIGNEFYYFRFAAAAGTGIGSSTTIAFPSLKKLSLKFISSLKKWVVPQASTTCFPLLEELSISGSPLLSTITPKTIIFPSLTVLYLYDISQSPTMVLVTNNLNYLTNLTLHQIHNLVTLPHQSLIGNNNTLLSLRILDCPQFKGFLLPAPNKDDDDHVVVSSSSSCSSSLQYLTLHDCPAMRFYPNVRSLTSLRSLVIQECKESRSLRDHLTCLSSSSLEHPHLVYVDIWKNKTSDTARELVFKWRRKSSY